MRRLVVPHLRDEILARAEDLLQQARVMIGTTARRQVVATSEKAAARLDILRSIQSELITIFNVDTLVDALSKNLPRLGVKGCYLSLYVNPQSYRYPQSAPEMSRAILAYNEEGRLELGTESATFPSRLLAPSGVWPEGRSFYLAAEPIYFQRNQLGFILFETNAEGGGVYETLRGLISSALEGAFLMIKEQRRGNLLRAVSLVSRALSSIIDSGEMIGRVVSLISEHFGLASTGLFIIDEVTGIETLRSSSGNAEARGGDSLIGACIEDARNRIALGAASGATSFLSSDRVVIALPLVSRSRVVGALSARCSLGEAFSDDEVKGLQTLSDRSFNKIKGQRSPEELLGKSDFDFFESALAEEYFAEERKIIVGGESLLEHEHGKLDDDRNEVWIQTSKVPLRNSEGSIIGLVGVSRDITQRKHDEKALRLQSSQFQTALDVAGTVNTLLDVEKILESVAALIREKFGFYCVAIFLIEDSLSCATLRAISSAAAMGDELGIVHLNMGDKSMISHAALSAEPRIAQDVSSDPLYMSSPRLPDTRSEADFPMLIGDASIGVLDIQSDRIYAFTKDSITILKTMAYQIAIAVQNARLHADEQERSRELSEAYKVLKEN